MTREDMDYKLDVAHMKLDDAQEAIVAGDVSAALVALQAVMDYIAPVEEALGEEGSA